MNVMIPTKYKEKPPRFLTYPAAAKVVSEALSDVPQFAELRLWFIRNDTGKVERDSEQRVLEARYLRSNLGLSASHDMDEAGWYGPAWDIKVYAVPHALHPIVRAAVVSHGFDLIREWLATRRTELWLTTSHRCALVHSPNEDRLIVDLTDN